MQPRDYFDESARQFGLAAASVTTLSESFRIAGHQIRFVFASVKLRDAYTPALAHLRCEEGDKTAPVEMTLHFWEGYDHPAPPPFANGIKPSFRGSTVEHLCNGEIQTITVPHTGMVVTFDFSGGAGYAWIADGCAIPAWELFSPMRTVMNLWLVNLGCQMIHGGAVALEGQGIIFAGPSGAGKSTTSLLCYDAGFQYLSDDYCIAEIRSDKPTRLHSLYRSSRMLPSHCDRLNTLVADRDSTRTEDGKSSFYLDLASRNPPGPVTLKALLLPCVTEEEKSRIVPCKDAAKAWRYVAPSTLAALYGGGAKSFQWITSVIRNTAAFELHLGRDPEDLVLRIREFLDGEFPV